MPAIVARIAIAGLSAENVRVMLEATQPSATWGVIAEGVADFLLIVFESPRSLWSFRGQSCRRNQRAVPQPATRHCAGPAYT
jgi:hypothetical protein